MCFNEFVALHARQAIITALFVSSFTPRLTRRSHGGRVSGEKPQDSERVV